MTSESTAALADAPELLAAAPHAPTTLDRKILQHFPGLAVRKDLTKGLKQNAVVPTYVLEYLLGQHCATDDPDATAAGLQSVQRSWPAITCTGTRRSWSRARSRRRGGTRSSTSSRWS
jgi:hypothetical protein